MMTSAADTPSVGCTSVGMPRPLSFTVQEPSGLSDTVTRSACPASASSIALSTASYTMWCRPEPSSVSPMYMPGRLRTASRPFKTLIESAPYASGSGMLSAVGVSLIRITWPFGYLVKGSLYGVGSGVQLRLPWGRTRATANLRFRRLSQHCAVSSHHDSRRCPSDGDTCAAVEPTHRPCRPKQAPCTIGEQD